MLLPCSPCCEPGCGVPDGKPRTDPKDEGTWVPAGTWTGVGGVTWTFTPNPGDDSGATWFFYGSAGTSKPGGGATAQEQQDWGNLCNWYSSKTTTPSSTSSLPTVLDKRATRLPDKDSVIHVYTDINNESVGDQTVKTAFFWAKQLAGNSGLTTTSAAHDSPFGAVFHFGSVGSLAEVNGGALIVNGINSGQINGGCHVYRIAYSGSVVNGGVINGPADFYGSTNTGTVNGLGRFRGRTDLSPSGATNSVGSTVDGGAEFYHRSLNYGTISNGVTYFHDDSSNRSGGIAQDGARFYNSSDNVQGTVNGGAEFHDASSNGNFGTPDIGVVNGGASFFDSSVNLPAGRVNGGAVFNDAACSRRAIGNYSAVPCAKKFVAHPTDLPTCNGTAPAACSNAVLTCGCG